MPFPLFPCIYTIYLTLPVFLIPLPVHLISKQTSLTLHLTHPSICTLPLPDQIAIISSYLNCLFGKLQSETHCKTKTKTHNVISWCKTLMVLHCTQSTGKTVYCTLPGPSDWPLTSISRPIFLPL